MAGVLTESVHMIADIAGKSCQLLHYLDISSVLIAIKLLVKGIIVTVK